MDACAFAVCSVCARQCRKQGVWRNGYEIYTFCYIFRYRIFTKAYFLERNRCEYDTAFYSVVYNTCNYIAYDKRSFSFGSGFSFQIQKGDGIKLNFKYYQQIIYLLFERMPINEKVRYFIK